MRASGLVRLTPRVMGGSSANVEAVRRFFDATSDYFRGNREPLETALRELCTPDVFAMPSSALASGDAGPFRRRRAILGQFAGIAQRWTDFEIMADEYVDVPPSTVVLLGKVRAKRGDGEGYAVEIGIVNRLDKGRIVSIHSYQSRRRALEEAGASDLGARPLSPEGP